MEYSAGILTLEADDNPNPDVPHHFNLRDVDEPTNAEVTSEDSGSVYDESLSLTRLEPVWTGTISALWEMFNLVGADGWQCISSDPKHFQAAKILWRALDKCTTDLGQTPNLQHTNQLGMLRLTTLTADRGQDATLSFSVDLFSDGVNAPFTINPAVAWPTEQINTGRYELGASAVAGVQLPNIEGITIDWNVTLTEKLTQFGSVYPEAVGVNEIKPTITIRGQDLSQVQDTIFKLGATPVNEVDTKIQLIKRVSDGEFDTTGSTTIIINANGLLVPNNTGTGSGRDRANNELMIQCRYNYVDGTPANDNFPLKITQGVYTPFS